MTTAERAQTLADTYGRPWWIVTSRSGQQRLTPDLADAAGWTHLQRFNPSGSFRLHSIQQPITLKK